MTQQQIRIVICGQLGALVQATGDVSIVRAAFEDVARGGDMYWQAMSALCSSETVDKIGRAAVQDAVKRGDPQ